MICTSEIKKKQGQHTVVPLHTAERPDPHAHYTYVGYVWHGGSSSYFANITHHKKFTPELMFVNYEEDPPCQI